MGKKYNTLNEEMNRMKSLFGESMLYGNIVDNENIVSEQYRFFRNLENIFKVTLKSFDDLGNFTKFINREIRNVDDIIKHLDEFDALWRVVLPNVKNWTGVKNNLKKLKTLRDSDSLKDIPEEIWVSKVLPGFPEKGGMRDMVNDMWRTANGKSPYLPQKVETRIVKTDPNSGALVVGTKSETGVVTYKNKDGDIVMVEKDPNVKVDDGGTNIKSDIEDVDYIEVKPDTPLDDLNGKKVAPTEENVKGVTDAVGEKVAEETKKGNKVVFTITGEGEEGIKAAQEMMEDITGNKGGTKSQDEVVEEVVEEIVDQNPDVDPTEVKKTYKDRLKNFAWGTRYWWNPTTYLPNEKWLAEKWGKNVTWERAMYPGDVKSRSMKIVFRLLILGGTYEVVKTSIDPDRDFFESGKNNIFLHIWEDLTKLVGAVKSIWNSDTMEDMTMEAIDTALLNIANTDVKVVKQKVIEKAIDEISYINSKEKNEDGSRKSTMTCTKLSGMSTDDAVIKHIIGKHKGGEIANELTRIKGELGGTGSEEYQKARNLLDQYFEKVIEKSIGIRELNQAIGEARTACEEALKQQSEIDYMNSEEYTVTIEGNIK